MNFGRRTTFDVVEKFKRFRAIYDKLFVCFVGSLWIFSTLWDIYQLQRYWLDYAIEFYSSFIAFFMIIYSISPKHLPKTIYNSFKLITTIKGRGILSIIISSLFLGDKHAFHKFCAILLFIGGLFYFICEILVPTTKEELDKIEEIYNPNINENKKIGITQVKINNININTQINTQVDKGRITNQINLNGNQNVLNNDNNKNNSINITQTILIDEIHENNNNIVNNNENDGNKKNTCENEIVLKTDNPYEIPEDF